MSYDELDDDEVLAEERRKAGRNRSIGLVVGLVALSAVGLGLAAKSCAGGRKDADRLTLRSAAAKFEASPANEGLARALAAEYEAKGKKAEAEQVLKRHGEAVAALARGKERELRAHVSAAPDDELALGLLVDLLARRKDLAGAKAEYAAFMQKSSTPKRQASYGAWLWRNGLPEEAARELSESLKGLDDPYSRAHLGLALFDLGKKRQARAEIIRAQEAGAEMDALNLRLYAIEQELGPVPGETSAPPKLARKKGKKHKHE